MSIGRPTKFDPKYENQAYKLCLLGATDKELASFFEVDVDTIYEWKKVHPTFSEALKAGKDDADANVANRLYQRAMGFEHDSEDIKVVEGEVVRVPIKKIYAPDTTAAIFWLKNRQRDKWRDRTDTDITTNGKELPTPIYGGLSVDPNKRS